MIASKWHTIENVTIVSESCPPGYAAEFDVKYEDLPHIVVGWNVPSRRPSAALAMLGVPNARPSGSGTAPSVYDVRREIYTTARYVCALRAEMCIAECDS